MNKINDLGGTAYIDSTGRLTIDGGTLTGTVAVALGFQTMSTTAAVSASGNTLETEFTSYADSNTQFSDLGFDGSVTVYNSLDEAIATITMGSTNTIQDFIDALAAQNIEATIADGVISMTSEKGNYICG